MLKPTIDKQLYSWGTTDRPSATYSSQAPVGATNVDYSELQQSDIDVPVPNNLGTRPVNLNNSKYGWIGAQGHTVASREIPSNVEYAELQQSDTVVPEPIVIPNFAANQFEVGIPDVAEKIPGVSPMQMADIILQYKKETQAIDYQQWVVAITAYKKIMIAKTIRDLTTEEKRIMSVVESQIKTEMQNISLTVPAPAPTPSAPTPSAPAAQPISSAPTPSAPAAQPISSSTISPRLQQLGSDMVALSASGAIAGVGLNEIIRTVGSLSLPDLSTLSSLIGTGVNASSQIVLNTITSMPITTLSIIAGSLAAGGAIRYYRNPATPVVQGVPQQPVVAVNPDVGVQIPIDIPANDPIQGVGDPTPGINNNPWLFNPANDPNNPWLLPIQGVGDPTPGINNNPIPGNNNPIPGNNNPLLPSDLDRSTAYNKWVASQSHNKRDGYYVFVAGLREMVVDFNIATRAEARKLNKTKLLNAIDNWVNAGGARQKEFQNELYETMP